MFGHLFLAWAMFIFLCLYMTAEWPGFGLLHPGLRVAVSDAGIL